MTSENIVQPAQTPPRGPVPEDQPIPLTSLAALDAAFKEAGGESFLSLLSHELRAPLTSMLAWIRLLRSGTLDERKTAHAFEVIERNTVAQARIIANLVDFSSTITGTIALERRVVRLETIVLAQLEEVARELESQRIQLTTEFEGGGAVWGDPERLSQVFGHLITNAIKFTPAEGRISVRQADQGDQVELVIEDTGIGVEPGFLPFLFEPFRREDGSAARRSPGLGVGLAIVRQLALAHGGTIEARSSGRWQGTTFVLRLPKPGGAHLPHGSAASTASGDEDPDLRGMRVVVVEDDADAREVLVTTLERCGAAAFTAPSAHEGWQVVQWVRPHVLIADIGMPDEDGYSLIRRVRTLGRARGGEVPALALTGFSTPDDRARALLSGFHAHVTKPVDPRRLSRLVAELATLSEEPSGAQQEGPE